LKNSLRGPKIRCGNPLIEDRGQRFFFSFNSSSSCVSLLCSSALGASAVSFFSCSSSLAPLPCPGFSITPLTPPPAPLIPRRHHTRHCDRHCEAMRQGGSHARAIKEEEEEEEMEEESARRLRRSCQQPFALAQVQGTVLLLHFSLNIPLLPAAAAPADTFAFTADRTRCIHVAVTPSRTGVVPPRAGQTRPSLSPPHRTAFPLPTHTPSRGLTFRIAGGAGTVPMAGQRVCVCVSAYRSSVECVLLTRQLNTTQQARARWTCW